MGFARELLARGDPTKAVAYQLGFKQPAHFCAVFKIHFSFSPLAQPEAEVSVQGQRGRKNPKSAATKIADHRHAGRPRY